MMRDEDIGRVLDEWFVEGPTQMPGRFFNATFDRIDRVPDRQFVPIISARDRHRCWLLF